LLKIFLVTKVYAFINSHEILRHTYEDLTAHRFAAAHRLGNASLETICR